MRKVVAAAFVSLDGVMQAPGGPEEDPTGGFAHGGWTTSFWDEMMGGVMGRMFDEPFDLLLGRKTYEIFAAHWPYAKDDPIGTLFGACTKYVATRQGLTIPWENTQVLAGDAAAAVAELKKAEGPTLLTQGSSDFLQTLIAADLIDEYRLLTFPVVLGRGKRLFGRGAHGGALKLTDTQSSTTGVTISTYVPAGAIPIGSFQHAEPSPAEVDRRRRMAAEA